MTQKESLIRPIKPKEPRIPMQPQLSEKEAALHAQYTRKSIHVCIGAFRTSILEESDIIEDGNEHRIADPKVEQFYREVLGLGNASISSLIDDAIECEGEEGGMYSISMGEIKEFVQIFKADIDTVRIYQVDSNCWSRQVMSADLVITEEETKERKRLLDELLVDYNKKMETYKEKKKEYDIALAQYQADMLQFEVDWARYRLAQAQQQQTVSTS